MKYALVRSLPDVPPGGAVAGIDWASADHAVCVVDMAGKVKDRFAAAHDRAGIAGLIARLRENRAGEVAIERGDGVLVDALAQSGLTVVVIGSRQVKNLRSRYGSSGAKDDPLTEPLSVSAAQMGCMPSRPTSGMSERSESQGRRGPIVSLFAAETGHTGLN